MADFDAAIAVVLEHEDPGLTGAVTVDSGGMTRWGISANSYPALDIRDLSLENAKAIYRRDYWAQIQGDKISAQAIATKVLDMAVNMGVVTACKMLQEATNRAWASPFPRALTVDGDIGPITLALVNRSDPAGMLGELRELSAAHYRAIAASDPPKYAQYLRGWMVRAEA